MEENVGLREPSYVDDAQQRKKRLRRRNDADDNVIDHDHNNNNNDATNDDSVLQQRLFGEDDLSDEEQPVVLDEFDYERGSDEDEDLFIEGARKKRTRRGGGVAAALGLGISAAKLDEAQSIFGSDKDLSEYWARGREQVVGGDDDDGGDDGDGDGGDMSSTLDGETRAQQRRARAERERQQLLRKFEPAVLAEKHLTVADELFKRCEAPERVARDFEVQASEQAAHTLLQLYAAAAAAAADDPDAAAAVPPVPVGKLLVRRPLPSDQELSAEARWILRNRLGVADAESDLFAKVKVVLELMRRELAEVPFIVQYKKECYLGHLTPEQIRQIGDADRDWHQLTLHRARVQQLVNGALRRPVALRDEGLAADDVGDVGAAAAEEIGRLRTAAFGEADAVAARLRGEYSVAHASSTAEYDDVARYCLLAQARHEAAYEAPQLQYRAKVLTIGINKLNEAISAIETDAELAVAEYLPKEVKELRIKNKAAKLAQPTHDVARLRDKLEALKPQRERLARRALTMPGMQIDQYRRALRLQLHSVAPFFGISAQAFGENVAHNYQSTAPSDADYTPTALAIQVAQSAASAAREEDASATVVADPEDVLAGVRALLVEEIVAEPAVRRAVRAKYLTAAVLSTEPTEKGDLEIDAFHAYANIKLLRNKPVAGLFGTPQFLAVLKAHKEGLISYELTVQGDHILREVLPLYVSDRVSDHARLWNDQRALIVREAINARLLPQLQRDVVADLTADAQRAVQRAVRAEARRLFEAGPYRRANEQASTVDDKDDFERTVMSFVWGGEDVPTMCAVLDRNGELKETLQLHHMYRIRTMQVNALTAERRTAPSDLVRDEQKQQDCGRIAALILAYRPVVIGVGVSAMQLEARDLLRDLFDIADQLYKSEKISRSIDVHAVDGVPARLWASSALARAEFADHHELTRQAIAVGRRLLDPLCAFACLFADVDRPIQYLPWHPLQSELPRESLLLTLESELVDAVCKVGVDVQRVFVHAHARPLLSFVAGLGERKAAALIRGAEAFGGRIASRSVIPPLTADERRERDDAREELAPRGSRKKKGAAKQLNDYDSSDDEEDDDDDQDDGGGGGGRGGADFTNVETLCQAIGGFTVWRNCVAFLNIKRLKGARDRRDRRDRTRVHPDDYLLVVKIALDLQTSGDRNVPRTFHSQLAMVRNLWRRPHELENYDYRGHAQYMRANWGADKRATLPDVIAEIRAPFADPRRPYEAPTPEALFYLLTGETAQTLQRGVLLQVVATLVGRSRVRCRLDCGVDGVLLAQDLSDGTDYIETCEDRVKRNQVLHARVLAVDFQKFEVSLSTKSSILAPDSPLVAERVQQLAAHEHFLDAADAFGASALRQRAERRAKRAAAAAAAANNSADALPVELNRLILHPLFKNVTYRAAEQELRSKPVGSVLFRPSTKGTDFLTMTWYFVAGPPPVFVHIAIHESDKGDNPATLGKKLMIDKVVFADFNEVLARYVEPMNDQVRRMVAFDKFSTLSADEAAVKLANDKRANPDAIPYLLRASDEHLGRFELVYQPTQRKSRREVVTLTPQGYRLRHKTFATPRELVNWFKLNWHKPIKRTHAAATTSAAGSSGAGASSSAAISTSAGATPTSSTPSMEPLSTTLAQLSSMGPLGGRAQLPPLRSASAERSTPSWANVRAAWMDQPVPQMMPPQPMMSGGGGGGWASGGWGAPPPLPSHMMPPMPLQPPAFFHNAPPPPQQQPQQHHLPHPLQRRF